MKRSGGNENEEEGKKQLCNEKRRRIERQQISDMRMSTDGKPGASYTYFFSKGTCGSSFYGRQQLWHFLHLKFVGCKNLRGHVSSVWMGLMLVRQTVMLSARSRRDQNLIMCLQFKLLAPLRHAMKMAFLMWNRTLKTFRALTCPIFNFYWLFPPDKLYSWQGPDICAWVSSVFHAYLNLLI